jgi:hypothetical protein
MKAADTPLKSLRNPSLGKHRGAGRALRLPAAMAGLLMLGACAGNPFGRTVPPAETVAAPPDPIVDFAARASPGATGSVRLAGGQPASVRLARSYYAASGRECREVLVGAGMSQRSQLVCKADADTWVASRPLLRGGAIQR